MTRYSTVPGVIKLHYQNGAFPHTQNLCVIPADPPVVGEEPVFRQADGGSILMSDALDLYMAAIRPIYAPETTFVGAEFWSQPTVDDDPIWVFEVPLGLLGTGTGDPALALEEVMSFRTVNGHLAKFYFMDPVDAIANNVRVPLNSFSSGANATLRNFLLDGSSIFFGRDNGRLVAPLFYNTKTNDTLRRKEITG
jgi:hypothetical protein